MKRKRAPARLWLCTAYGDMLAPPYMVRLFRTVPKRKDRNPDRRTTQYRDWVKCFRLIEAQIQARYFAS